MGREIDVAPFDPEAGHGSAIAGALHRCDRVVRVVPLGLRVAVRHEHKGQMDDDGMRREAGEESAESTPISGSARAACRRSLLTMRSSALQLVVAEANAVKSPCVGVVVITPMWMSRSAKRNSGCSNQ